MQDMQQIALQFAVLCYKRHIWNTGTMLIFFTTLFCVYSSTAVILPLSAVRSVCYPIQLTIVLCNSPVHSVLQASSFKW